MLGRVRIVVTGAAQVTHGDRATLLTRITDVQNHEYFGEDDTVPFHDVCGRAYGAMAGGPSGPGLERVDRADHLLDIDVAHLRMTGKR